MNTCAFLILAGINECFATVQVGEHRQESSSDNPIETYRSRLYTGDGLNTYEEEFKKCFDELLGRPKTNPWNWCYQLFHLKISPMEDGSHASLRDRLESLKELVVLVQAAALARTRNSYSIEEVIKKRLQKEEEFKEKYPNLKCEVFTEVEIRNTDDLLTTELNYDSNGSLPIAKVSKAINDAFFDNKVTVGNKQTLMTIMDIAKQITDGKIALPPTHWTPNEACRLLRKLYSHLILSGIVDGGCEEKDREY